MSRYGAPQFSSLLKDCVLWATMQDSAGVSGGIDEFPILPSGVMVTNNGTFTKTALGNNRSVLNFDGSTNYISLTDNDAWDIFGTDYTSSQFTISGWIKFLTPTTHVIIVSQRYVNNTNRWHVFWSYTLNYLVVEGIVSGSSIGYKYIPFTPTNDVWYYITIVKSGLNCYMYINSDLQSVQTTTAFSGVTTFATPLTIGFENTWYAKCNLAHLMIWKGRALTQPEIELLMNRTHPITGAGLMPANGDYWRLS